MKYIGALLPCLVLVLAFSPTPGTSADFTGPFFMCPDAHGEEQKQRFRMIDIEEGSMRIEGLGPITLEGFGARVAESKSNAIMSGQDPIEEAFGKLFSDATVFSAIPQKRLAAACFAQTPPPKEEIDGPFVFMPGFLVEDGQIDPGKDSITIPAQTYLVLKFTGPGSAVGDMRFSLTEGFWRDRAPALGLERADGPNLMIWAQGDYGAPEGSTTLEMWTPIKPPLLAKLDK